MPLGPDEFWLDVVVLFAGLQVPGRIQLASNVSIEQILEANLVANAVRIASEVQLGLPSRPDDASHPVCGLRYRVLGKRIYGAEEAAFNSRQIARPKRAFLRAVALIRGLELVHGGTFVHEVDDAGIRRLQSYQFNAGTLSRHYDAAYFDDGHADDLRSAFEALLDPYMSGDGQSIGVAIDRLGAAAIRSSQVDTNLDLCIAAEIAFLFGLQDRTENEGIAETVRTNARAFFGDEEFCWGREDVFEIARDSYRERSHTIHGRRVTDESRNDILVGLNVRLREVLKVSLRAYVERRPSKAAARLVWPVRRQLVSNGKSLGPIFV